MRVDTAAIRAVRHRAQGVSLADRNHAATNSRKEVDRRLDEYRVIDVRWRKRNFVIPRGEIEFGRDPLV